MQEDNQRTTKTKPQKIGEEHKRRANTRTRKMKNGGKEEENRGKHASSP